MRGSLVRIIQQNLLDEVEKRIGPAQVEAIVNATLQTTPTFVLAFTCRSASKERPFSSISLNRPRAARLAYSVAVGVLNVSRLLVLCLFVLLRFVVLLVPLVVLRVLEFLGERLVGVCGWSAWRTLRAT